MKIKKVFLYIAVCLSAFLLILFSENVQTAALHAVNLCLTRLIPSLFPFFVLSSFVSLSGISADLSRLCENVMMPAFGVSGTGALPLLLGFFGGYPVGAKTVSELYAHNEITKSEAVRLLFFACNTGPSVIFGLCATVLFSSVKAGLILYGIHIVSALLLGILAKLFCGNCETRNAKIRHTERQNSASCFVQSVENAIGAMMNVCGFVVLFNVMIALVKAVKIFPSGSIGLVASGLCELSSGLDGLREIAPDTTRAMCLASLFLGFGGLCVFLQSSSFIVPAKLPVSPYFFGKVLHGALSYGLTRLFMFWSRVSEVFSFTGHTTTKDFIFDYLGLFYSCACFLAGVLLMIRWKIKHRHDL